MTENQPDVTIRRLDATEGEVLARLAQRDTSPVPTGDVLAAFAPGGALVAAISLETGALVADPFRPSEHAVGLLRVRARQVSGDTGESRRRRLFRRRPSAASAAPAGPS